VKNTGVHTREVKQILDAETRYRKRHNSVQSAGYSKVSTSWELPENIEYVQELVEYFQQTQHEKPRMKRIDFPNWKAEQMN
jgi:hypothetical protein